ncbi:MAG: hypothetical protein PHP50_09915 [Lachnospiraceae bacterium]|nr:hypothetical protein [Lachnospiraceae bacterium]
MKYLKRGFPIFFFAAVIIGMLLLSDEGSEPITLTGNELKVASGSIAYDYVGISEGEGGMMASTEDYFLNKGTYTIGLGYHTDTDLNNISITDNGSLLTEFNLDKTVNYDTFSFTLDKDSQFLTIAFNYGGSGYFIVNNLTLIPEGTFYTDTYYYIFLVIVLAFALFLFCPIQQKADLKRKTIFLILLGLGIFSFYPYMTGYLPWGDDICYHIVRIEGIKDGLLSGQLPVVIYPEGLRGYGFLNCMYPNLFLYIPAILRIFGVSISATYKSLIFLFQLATPFITYGCVRSLEGKTDSARAGLLAAFLYCLCPYRFTNFYARGALGEALAMTFFPLLIAGLYHVLLGNRKKWWLLVLGISGLLQTHILSCMLGIVFCVVLGFVCIGKVIREKRFLEIGIAAFVSLLINLWFLVSFIYFFINGNLSTTSLDWSTYSEYSLLPYSLFGTINNIDFRTYSLGLPLIVCLAFVLFEIMEKGKENPEETSLHHYLVYVGAAGIVCVLLTLYIFPAWNFMDIAPLNWFFKNIQFPWRLLGPASAFFAIAGSIALCKNRLFKPYVPVLCVTLTIVSLLSVTHYNATDGDYYAYEDFTDTYTEGHYMKLIGIPKTENTIVYPYEWQPDHASDAVMAETTIPRFSDADSSRQVSYHRDGIVSTLVYTNTSTDAFVEFPLLFYPGYAAADENGNVLEITEGNGATVRVSLSADSAEHKIIVTYKSPVLMTGAFLISLCSVIVIACLYAMYYFRQSGWQLPWKRFRK